MGANKEQSNGLVPKSFFGHLFNFIEIIQNKPDDILSINFTYLLPRNDFMERHHYGKVHSNRHKIRHINYI